MNRHACNGVCPITEILPSEADQARFRRGLQRAPVATLIQLACRIGYAARGAVYVSMGLIALLAAFEFTPHAESALGAVEAWANWPFGTALLWLVALGLCGFAGWRALQSLLDADHQGRSLKAIASRVGQAVSGVVYGGLALSIFELLEVFDDLKEDDHAETREGFSRLLAAPGGELVMIGLGVFILGVGAGNIVQAVRRDFCKDLACDRRSSRWIAALGRIGYLGRGIAFVPAGFLAIRAGLVSRVGAQGVGAALDTLERQPFGSWLLALTALGLVAFGLFAFAEARYRVMSVEATLQELPTAN